MANKKSSEKEKQRKSNNIAIGIRGGIATAAGIGGLVSSRRLKKELKSSRKKYAGEKFLSKSIAKDGAKVITPVSKPRLSDLKQAYNQLSGKSKFISKLRKGARKQTSSAYKSLRKLNKTAAAIGLAGGALSAYVISKNQPKKYSRKNTEKKK